MTKPKEKPHISPDSQRRKSGERRKMNLTPEESEKILKRVFLGEDEESENKKRLKKKKQKKEMEVNKMKIFGIEEFR